MVATSNMDQIADVVFVIEGTAINGAYINDLKQNYIIPTLEYFSQGVIDDRDFYLTDRTSTMYGIILYRTAQVGLGVCCLTHGPFSSPQKVLNTIDRLELTGGRSESNANLAEGMATALICFDDFDVRRENNYAIHKHCILICNSPPYSMPVMDCYLYENKNVEQLATIFQEKNIHLSILSPRKIPILFKIFEKAGGDLNQSTTKNYCKDPRHLVLLKGYSLKERPISPSMQGNGPTLQLGPNFMTIGNKDVNQMNVTLAMGPRPILSGFIDQNQQPSNMQFLNQTNQQGQPQTAGGMMQQTTMGAAMGYITPQQQQQSNINRGVVNRAWLLQQQQQQQQQQVQQQQRQFVPAQLQQQPGQPPIQQNSALISQLTTPPHPMTNQLNNPQMQNLNQQEFIRMLSQQQMLQNQQLQQQQQQQQQQQNQNLMNPGMQQQPALGSVMLKQNQMNPQQAVQPQQVQQNQNQAQQQQQQAVQQGQMVQSQQQSPMREKIWSGIIEWTEKIKNDQPKVTRHVPCYVTSGLKDGELDIKADNWPSRLIMQLMPKQLIGSIGGQYLKDAKTVVFHPNACDSLDALSKVLSSGFAGCVHFNTPPNQCEIKILILLFTNEKKAYLGFIPNNQNGFVDRLRKVIAQKQGASRLVQGSQQQQPQPGQPGQQTIQQQSVGNMPTASKAQNPQLMQMVQTQIQMQQTGSRIGLVNMPGLQQQQAMGNSIPNQMQNIRGPSQSQMVQQQQQQPQQQRFEFDQRQQTNMDKMSHLKQSLEQGYDTYGQMPMQMQDTMQPVQQQQSQQDQYKLLLMQQQQQRNNMANSQANQLNQQRMIRPGVPGASNPGLRHLLQQQQQQPQNTQQYRQVMGMQQQNIGQMGGVPRPQNQQNSQQFEEPFDFFVSNE